MRSPHGAFLRPVPLCGFFPVFLPIPLYFPHFLIIFSFFCFSLCWQKNGKLDGANVQKPHAQATFLALWALRRASILPNPAAQNRLLFACFYSFFAVFLLFFIAFCCFSPFFALCVHRMGRFCALFLFAVFCLFSSQFRFIFHHFPIIFSGFPFPFKVTQN